MSYAKLHFRQNCVYGSVSLSCIMRVVDNEKGFLEEWVTAFPVAQCSQPHYTLPMLNGSTKSLRFHLGCESYQNFLLPQCLFSSVMIYSLVYNTSG